MVHLDYEGYLQPPFALYFQFLYHHTLVHLVPAEGDELFTGSNIPDLN